MRLKRVKCRDASVINLKYSDGVLWSIWAQWDWKWNISIRAEGVEIWMRKSFEESEGETVSAMYYHYKLKKRMFQANNPVMERDRCQNPEEFRRRYQQTFIRRRK